MTHDDEEDEEDGEIFYSDPFERPGSPDPFDDSWRFGFSMGPNGMRIHEPPMFGQILREMEDIFSELGRWENQHGPFGEFKYTFVKCEVRICLCKLKQKHFDAK